LYPHPSAPPRYVTWREKRAKAVRGKYDGSISTLVFFLTWFPTYLATERHMGWVGCVALIGAMSYIFILGDVHRLEID
jgi:hypothetical protein